MRPGRKRQLMTVRLELTNIVAVGRSVIDKDVVTFLNFPRETGHGVMRPATLDIEYSK